MVQTHLSQWDERSRNRYGYTCPLRFGIMADPSGVECRIKQTLLSMLSEMSFRDVTVRALCGRAHIGRGTFYLHYKNLNDLLDSIIDEVLGNDPPDKWYRCGFRKGEPYNCPYGICDKVRAHPGTAVVFFDESLAPRIIERVSAFSKEMYVRSLMAQCDLTRTEAETIFVFQLNGCLAVNRLSYQRGDVDWENGRDLIAGFIQGGIERYAR